MKVVSLCNQLSRSIQLRRKQSSDTLDSKSDEVGAYFHNYPKYSDPLAFTNLINKMNFEQTDWLWGDVT